MPDGAGVVVNLTGPSVDLDVDSLLAPGGATVDPSADPYFADLATHLLWNVPGASTVDVAGQAQLPGSLLVGTGASTTTLRGAGTNGRVLVAGDLVHTGAGELHSYPFLRDPDLTCGPDLKHLGALTLDVLLQDPGNIVDPDRFFEGTFACFLDGEDVTPGDGTWQLRAQADDRVLSEDIPVGALCFVDERLEVPPAPGWDWAEPEIAPAKVKVAKRDPRGFTVTNRVQPVKTPPPPPSRTRTPRRTRRPSPPPRRPRRPRSRPTSRSTPRTPTPRRSRPHRPTSPSSYPSSRCRRCCPPRRWPRRSSRPPATARSRPPSRRRLRTAPGPLTTTAPYSLRGAFVWGPLLLLSVLALRLRFPWRPRRQEPGALH